jgi:hypothetical protein
MPLSRTKPSEIAAEIKRIYMPYIFKTFYRHDYNSVTSVLYPDTSAMKINPSKRTGARLRVAVVEGDPVDYALGWYQYISANSSKPDSIMHIPVVNMANEKRAGGDWESGLMAPEECFARRSNLVQALAMPWRAQLGTFDNLYPIPQRGGIYTQQVCKFAPILWPMQLPDCVYRCNPGRSRSELHCVERSEMASGDLSSTSAQA